MVLHETMSYTNLISANNSHVNNERGKPIKDKLNQVFFQSDKNYKRLKQQKQISLVNRRNAYKIQTKH